MPGHSNGSRSRADVVFAVSDAVRHQALTLSWHHSQGEFGEFLKNNQEHLRKKAFIFGRTTNYIVILLAITSTFLPT